MSLKIPEHLVVAIFREDVRCRDEPPHGLDLDHLPEGPPHEQRLQEGQHGRRDRQPHVRRRAEIHGPHSLPQHALVRSFYNVSTIS